MKARLYRGPFDGHIHILPDSQTRLTCAKSRNGFFRDDSPGLYASAAMNTYSYVRTRHTHPDGSVYFEWDKPKGTKFNA